MYNNRWFRTTYVLPNLLQKTQQYKITHVCGNLLTPRDYFRMIKYYLTMLLLIKGVQSLQSQPGLVILVP